MKAKPNCSALCGCTTSNKMAAPKQSSDSRFRDHLIRTNLDLFLIGTILAVYHIGQVYASEEAATDEHAAATTTDEHASSGEELNGGEHSEEEVFSEEKVAIYAILYPWFVEIFGVIVYYFLSRYVHALPYTAVMFIIGFFIGFSVQRTELNAITFSANTWIGINGHVILLVFLPGLLYLDSYGIDIHLFLQSFWQLVTFAFPMVLGGTALTACVAYYIFPYGWSLDLSMTFGAILAATDPVAVAVLLNELGAPPRLKMHISGESLMNDGSAVVFYNIFSQRFFYEMGIPGVGADIGWGQGFLLFFRLSLGGMCIGLAFGVCTVLVLYNLNRRLSGEDSVVQVVLTITAAYLVFFTSEILAQCSGIIAVMFCGLTVKAMGETMINDVELMHHFWEITEWLLNTLLFTLGGTVWGDIISNNRGITTEFEGAFVGSDWGYLILLYVMLTIIRFFLLAAFFPLTARIGIGTNWKEAVFMGWGGLRGAVGIALALSLNSEVTHYTSASEVDEQTRHQYRDYTAKLFGFVGGIALLTLVINGVTSGPLLQKLGLVTPTETRKKVVENYHQHMVNHAIEEYVSLLADERFKDLDYTVIKQHVSFLRDITLDQLMAAVKRHKEKTPEHKYQKPNLKNVVPYLYKFDATKENGQEEDLGASVQFHGDVKVMRRKRQTSVQAMRRDRTARTTVFDLKLAVDENEVYEERLIFLKILRSSYYKQIEQGELESRGFIAHSLFRALDLEEDRAVRGLSLNDWEALQVASSSWARPAEYLRKRVHEFNHHLKGNKGMQWGMEFFLVHLQVRQALSFIHAHKRSAQIFKEEFTNASNTLSAAEKVVLDESVAQIRLADKTLLGIDREDVKMIKSHYACQVLLTKSAHYFTKLSNHGLMTQKEAGVFMEEIEEEIYELSSCRQFVHQDEIDVERKMQRFSRIPDYMVSNMELDEEVLEYRNSRNKAGDTTGFFSPASN